MSITALLILVYVFIVYQILTNKVPEIYVSVISGLLQNISHGGRTEPLCRSIQQEKRKTMLG